MAVCLVNYFNESEHIRRGLVTIETVLRSSASPLHPFFRGVPKDGCKLFNTFLLLARRYI